MTKYLSKIKQLNKVHLVIWGHFLAALSNAAQVFSRKSKIDKKLAGFFKNPLHQRTAVASIIAPIEKTIHAGDSFNQIAEDSPQEFTKDLSNLGSAPMEESYDPELALKFPLKILVADDNLTNRLVASRFLEKLGYAAALVSNGAEALSQHRTNNYDLILMDIQMPEMDGLAATAAIRKLDKAGSQPWIVAFTASAGKREKAQQEKHYQKMQMDGVVFKPFSVACLQEAILKLKATGTAHPPVDATLQPLALLKRFENDEDILIAVIDIYLKNSPQMREQLAQAIANFDPKEINYAAHQLKSSLSIFNIPELQRQLHQIEGLAHQDQLPPIHSLWIRVKPDLERLEIDLENIISSRTKVA